MANEISSKELKRIVISGGGTGGTYIPTLIVAQESKTVAIRNVVYYSSVLRENGAVRIPAAGYPIKLLPVQGLPRGRNPFAKIKSVFNLLKSVNIAQTHLSDFRATSCYRCRELCPVKPTTGVVNERLHLFKSKIHSLE